MFNSSLAYEISVLKPYVEPLLFSIKEEAPEYQEAKRLLKFLEYFLPCGTEYIPVNSIMREFVDIIPDIVHFFDEFIKKCAY